MMTREEIDKLSYWVARSKEAERALVAIASLPDQGRGYGDLAVITARNAINSINQ